MSYSPYDRNTNIKRASHDTNIERRIMERDSYFNLGTRNDNTINKYNTDNINSNYKKKNIGEITGQNLNYDNLELEQGMPLRQSVSESKKLQYDDYDKMNSHNKYLDFDLFNDNNQNNYASEQVSSYDPRLEQNINHELSNTVNHQKNYTKTIATNIQLINNDFGVDIYNEITKHIQNKPCVMSPYSLLLPFIMLYLGSAGTSEKELRNFFNFSDKNNTLLDICKNFESIIRQSSILIKNVIYLNNKLPINPGYAKQISLIGSVDSLNCKNSVQESTRINQFISETTNGLIRNIISPNSITTNTMSILLNIIYFKSKWKYTFNKKETKEDKFYVMNQNQIQTKIIPTMNMSNTKFNYYEDQHNQIIELDFKDEILTMGFVLGKKILSPTITSETLEKYIEKLNYTKINKLQIPKFKQKNKYSLIPLLKQMGLQTIFEKLNISNMILGINDDNKINEIIHEAVVIVDEDGAEASAVTMLRVDTFGSDSKTINFIADHPFVYYIRHKNTNTILFIGMYC